MSGVPQRNDLTRAQQRIVTRLMGGGSLRHTNATETADLRLYGLVDDNGLTTAGLEVSLAALALQQDARRAELIA